MNPVSDVSPTVFRASRIALWIGSGASIFWAYVVLYAVGIINWPLFPRIDEFSVDQSVAGRLAGLTLVATIGLAADASRRHVEISSDSLRYVRIFGSSSIRWSDVNLVRVREGTGCIEISSDDCRVSISMIGDFVGLRNAIISSAKTNSPNVEIQQVPRRN